MSPVEEHVEWMRSLGLRVEDFAAVEPAEGVPGGLPSDLADWFRLRMPNRVGFDAIGQPGDISGFWMQPAWDENESWRVHPEDFEEAQELGLFPYAPVGFVLFEDQGRVVETIGLRAGWVYANDYFDKRAGGPVATSVGEVLRVTRVLTEVGLIDPTRVERTLIAKPPLDTPIALISYSCDLRPVGHWHGFPIDQPTIARSIRDLLPDFEFLMPLVPVEELE